jgi:hypothetical protein
LSVARNIVGPRNSSSILAINGLYISAASQIGVEHSVIDQLFDLRDSHESFALEILKTEAGPGKRIVELLYSPAHRPLWFKIVQGK